MLWYRHLLAVAFVDNNLIFWSIQLKCILDFRGLVAFLSQLPEVKAPHPENMDV